MAETSRCRNEAGRRRNQKVLGIPGRNRCKRVGIVGRTARQVLILDARAFPLLATTALFLLVIDQCTYPCHISDNIAHAIGKDEATIGSVQLVAPACQIRVPAASRACFVLG